MSSYTTIKANISPKNNLTENKINKIIKRTTGLCGYADNVDIQKDNVSLTVTFNHNLKGIIDLIIGLESIIDYDKITEIGMFKSEDIAGYDYTSLYAFKNNIFIVKTESFNGMGFSQEDTHISNLRGISKNYSKFVDSNTLEDENTIETNIKEFFKTIDFDKNGISISIGK